MLQFLLKYCTDCNSLQSAICDLDGVLAQYGKNSWENISYMTNKATPHVKIREIIYYKDILENLKWNQSFYYPYTMQQIVSRVNIVVSGEKKIQKRYNLPVYTSSTTTTTTTT